MRKTFTTTFLLAALASAILAGSALAAEEFDKYAIESASASLSTTQAGAHPDFFTTLKIADKEGLAYAKTRDVVVNLPAGLFGNPQPFPKCTTLQFGTLPENNECPLDSQVGSIDITISGLKGGTFQNQPIFNMPVPGGDTAARFGFFAGGFPIFLTGSLDPETNHILAKVQGAPSAAELVESQAVFWGVPAAPVHDPERITPWEAFNSNGPPGGHKSTLPEVPFLTNPTSCGPGKQITFTARSYQEPEVPRTLTVPFPQIAGCGAVEFTPSVGIEPTTSQGASGTGLNFSLSLPTKGLQFGNLSYGSELKRTEVILPEGMTLNPSASQGLGVCSEADLARERYDSGPNVGCPESSKIGSVTATSPVLDRDGIGSLYLAKPYENPFGSLLALYLVIKVPDRGVLVKVAGKVSPDPKTGQIVTVFDEAPQLPVSTVDLHFREGARAPLITPRTCGTYQAITKLSPWSVPDSAVARVSDFSIESGPEHGPCPPGATPPFVPGFEAGTTSNTAGSYSPFNMRVTRRDGDQDLTKFTAVLPPGLVAKLAGTTQCPDAAIAQARGRTGQDGGREEQASPSCPASSHFGHVLAGAGVGQSLTYVEGQLYLAGPYKGAPLSVVAIVPAVAGPFDVGTVVTRQALRIDPRTSVVTVDGESSDPIPHILQGIPLSVRDIRVYVDKPQFTLNPTSCAPLSMAATIWGGGADVFGAQDDSPLFRDNRFQAAECAALGFKPKLSLKLKGGTGRGGHPALTGTYKPRAGDANLSGLVLRLPRSAFLDQGHIRTICTRVQFAANGGNGGGCPQGAVYGHATAYTPILSEPLSGPVILRSSNHKLPDFVATLHGLVDVEAVARIDSKGGGIRATFTEVPDAPIAKVVVEMQGQKKGLIVNSTDLCEARHRANAQFEGHNGKSAKGRPVVGAVGCR
jgi:hypothetical protein